MTNLSNVNKTYKLQRAGMKNALKNNENMLKLKNKTTNAVTMIFQFVYDLVFETHRLL